MDKHTAVTSEGLEFLAGKARQAALQLQDIAHDHRVEALRSMARAIRVHSAEILRENALDCLDAKASGLGMSLYKRLELDEAKIEQMAVGLESVTALPDPVGVLQEKIELDSGLVLEKVSCPLGVLAIIFESRPDVVPQVVGLSVKSGNAVIFKGGSEALRSNRVLHHLLHEAGVQAGLPDGFACIVESREAVSALLQMDDSIDLIIPRGSNALVRSIMDSTRIPVLGHADGICTMYLDSQADHALAVRLVHDAKTQYPAVCNAIENLLVHCSRVDDLLPAVIQDLIDTGVEIRGDRDVCNLFPGVRAADEADWDTEYNDLILSVKIVDSLDEAIEFINLHGSGHTDAIVTGSDEAASRFVRRVDSSSVMVNASTRFADGYRYGKGAEIGISTNKTHARGPVGLEGLVIYKYVLRGEGQCVADYSGAHARSYTHRKIL